MAGSDRGLYPKYEVYKDGDEITQCFVLEPESDEDALVALEAYAKSTDNEALATELTAWILRIRQSLHTERDHE